MSDPNYIHGVDAAEQRRLIEFNRMQNASFLAFLDLRGARSILEVGSGLGILTEEVARRAPDAEVVGVEFSEAQLAGVKAKAPNLRFVRGDAHELEFEDGRFDVVYGRWVLEHVADPARVAREMRRVLKPGGRAFAQENDVSIQRFDPPTPAVDRMWTAVIQLQERLGGDAVIGRKLCRLFVTAGFRDVEVTTSPEVHRSGTEDFRGWVENEIRIFRGCAEELGRQGLATADDVERATGELSALMDRPDAVSWFHWNQASGRK